MAFRKAIGAEALDLFETAFGEIAWVISRDHAFDHFCTKCLDDTDAFEGRHGTAQFVGLSRGEACGDDGNLHRLFLEERNAKRLLQHLFELW